MAYENDSNYWWLRLQYALRDGCDGEAEVARQQLARLGFDVKLKPVAQTSERPNGTGGDANG